MTAPRQVLAGSTYFITCRCLRREARLRPGRLPNQLFGYLLARAAWLTGIQVHVMCVMSNHYHLVVTDPGGELPRFQQELDGLAARAFNALHGVEGRFWEGDSYNAVLLDSPDVILDRCAYALANPAAAGLVRHGRKWPGLWSAPEDAGRTLEFERPTHFFNPDGQQPRACRLELKVPPGCGPVASFREALQAALARKEEAAARVRTAFLGVARVLRQPVFARPRSPERHRTLVPRFAARDHGRRVELARRLRAFLAEYREALQAWREGRRDTVFPVGTYLMRVLHQAVCAGAG